MKHIIFCTYPSIYSSIVLQQLVDTPQIHVDAIITSTVSKNNTQFPSLSILKNSGLRYASYLWIVTTLFDLLPKKKLPSVGEIAKINGISCFKTSDVNDSSTTSFLEQHPANHLVTTHFNQIIDVTLPYFSKRKCINMHPSLLPKNKGLDPVFYALLRKEKQQGVTLHKITNAVDGGNIYAQHACDVPLDRSLFIVNMQLFESGASLLIQTLQTGKIGMPQDGEGNYDSWPHREDTHKVKSFIRLRDFFIAIY